MIYNTLTDIELVEACRNNDVKAFDALFYRYSGKLYRYAMKYVNDAVIAEETMLDTMLWVWEKRQELQLKGDFAPYIFSAMKHAVIKAVTKKVRYELMHEPENGHRSLLAPPADERVHHHELETVFEQKLASLSPQRKLIFMMSRYEHLTHDQIARKLNLSVFTVKNHMKASLKYFREHLKAYTESTY